MVKIFICPNRYVVNNGLRSLLRPFAFFYSWEVACIMLKTMNSYILHVLF